MVSEEDACAMQTRYAVRSVSAVPTGVDTEFFAPLGLVRERADLVFTGSMDWFPNEDAVVFFCKDVLPKLRTPGVTFTIVGRNPSARVRHLEMEPGVRVTGTVEDVRPFIDRAAVYVVPLRIGGGTRIKIFEAMAMAKPVVSTSLGAEGLPVTANTHLLLADDPLAFAQCVDRLLEDEASAAALGTRARRVAVESWSWDAAASAFEDICDQVVERYKWRHES
jgi:polysaccharide biosynthesis protein PslH